MILILSCQRKIISNYQRIRPCRGVQFRDIRGVQSLHRGEFCVFCVFIVIADYQYIRPCRGVQFRKLGKQNLVSRGDLE